MPWNVSNKDSREQLSTAFGKTRNKLKLLIVAKLILLSGCASGYIGSSVGYLVVDGSANATIVKPAVASIRESFAAAEWQRYIEKNFRCQATYRAG